MVDFAIYVEEDAQIIAAMKSLFQRRPSIPVSVNQTLDQPLRTTSIAISIETKKQSIEWDTAILQVGIWAAAQFAKLEELIDDSPLTEGKSRRVEAARRNMPFLPLIIVLGHDWYFLAATRESDGETRVWSKLLWGIRRRRWGFIRLWRRCGI
jgi:hypothetical protein